ncbi:MAG: hypothetical protein Q4E54_06680 [Lachnospiraceae bacterium]|nr:hypothetical protein [Lachnospiraceae bacterium]
MNTTRKEIIIHSLKTVLGLELFAFAVYLMIQVDIGLQPWDIFTQGIADKIGTLYGNVQTVISVILVLIDVFILKEKIGIGTLLDAALVGKSVDLFNWIGIIPKMEGMLVLRILIFIAGLFLAGIGQYIYITQGLSTGPRDSFQIGLTKKLKKFSVGTVNIFIMVTVAVLGVLLGGPFGIGTFIGAIGMGTVQNIVFGIAGFDPKILTHQDVITSVRILLGKEK